MDTCLIKLISRRSTVKKRNKEETMKSTSLQALIMDKKRHYFIYWEHAENCHQICTLHTVLIKLEEFYTLK